MLRTKTLRIAAFTCLAILLPAESVFPLDLSVLKEMGQRRYFTFGETYRDLTIRYETKTRTLKGERVTKVRVYKQGRKFRKDSNTRHYDKDGLVSDETTTIIFDGVYIWTMMPNQRRIKTPGVNVNDDRLGEHWWKFVPDDVSLIGTETIGDRLCNVIRYHGKTRRMTPFSRFWIDQKDLVLVMAAGTDPAGHRLQVVNSDFRTIWDKWVVPFKTEHYQNDELYSTEIVEEYATDKGLPKDLFNSKKVNN